jgi:DNA/RNA endonuclease YhcR with UshA esterase domain
MRAKSIGLVLLAVPTVMLAQGPISPAEAAQHVGETATVCGTVASVTYAHSSRGRPTFLNLDQPYPNQVFTVVIWGTDRAHFRPAPEVNYANARICVTGLITTFRGVPEIVVHSPSAIRLIGQRSSLRSASQPDADSARQWSAATQWVLNRLRRASEGAGTSVPHS